MNVTNAKRTRAEMYKYDGAIIRVLYEKSGSNLATSQHHICLSVCSRSGLLYNFASTANVGCKDCIFLWKCEAQDGGWGCVWENRVLTIISGSNREEAKGHWRKEHNEELHNFFSFPDTAGIMNLKTRLAGNVECMGLIINAYKTWSKNSRGEIIREKEK